ncbi:hypothetical protein B0J11DRAFT_320432 [Dendryphion nanum]|uniref:Uncharacterized protein n=1 Tax=Dendryphion nanum TaxID=256645 RepID=A0A9P9IKK0_9PLEO|nr:hypothetical protein B0J11DRAFT_320432 [Dendryphion nanum]
MKMLYIITLIAIGALHTCFVKCQPITNRYSYHVRPNLAVFPELSQYRLHWYSVGQHVFIAQPVWLSYEYSRSIIQYRFLATYIFSELHVPTNYPSIYVSLCDSGT